MNERVIWNLQGTALQQLKRGHVKLGCLPDLLGVDHCHKSCCASRLQRQDQIGQQRGCKKFLLAMRAFVLLVSKPQVLQHTARLSIENNRAKPGTMRKAYSVARSRSARNNSRIAAEVERGPHLPNGCNEHVCESKAVAVAVAAFSAGVAMCEEGAQKGAHAAIMSSHLADLSHSVDHDDVGLLIFPTRRIPHLQGMLCEVLDDLSSAASVGHLLDPRWVAGVRCNGILG